MSRRSRWIALLLVAAFVVAASLWGTSYYQHRYSYNNNNNGNNGINGYGTAYDSPYGINSINGYNTGYGYNTGNTNNNNNNGSEDYYAVVPKQAQAGNYSLKAYNSKGEEKQVSVKSSDTAAGEKLEPGSFIIVREGNAQANRIQKVNKESIPKKALEKLESMTNVSIL